MEDQGKQQNDFDLVLKLRFRFRRQKVMLPWAAVAGLALINSSKFWNVVEQLLSRVG